MTIDYKQLQALVKEAMFIGDGPGGMMGASAPAGVPHRMPAGDNGEKEQAMGDPKANKIYDIALMAREAAEELIVALEDPTYDAPYEHAFKATTALRKVLNGIEALGAHPMPTQRVVAPPANQQKWAGGSTYAGYSGGAWGGGGGMGGMEEAAKLEVTGISSPVQRSVEMYNKMNDKDKQAFQAFILGGATGEK